MPKLSCHARSAPPLAAARRRRRRALAVSFRRAGSLLTGGLLTGGLLAAQPAAAWVQFPGVSADQVARVTVTTAAAAVAAAKAATRPTEIILAPGHYAMIDLRSINPGHDVVFRSQSDSSPAVVNRLNLHNSSRLRFERLVLPTYRQDGEFVTTAGVTVNSSNNISFSSCHFHGTLNDDPNDDATMLRVTNASRVLLFNSTFQQARLGFSFRSSNRVLAYANRVFDVREGSNWEVLDTVYIERNHFSRIYPNADQGDHADAVQFWPRDGVASNRVWIRNNAFILDRGSAQAVFIRSSSVANGTFTQVYVQHNVIYNRVRQGIWIEGARSVMVERNTLVAGPDPIYEPAIWLRRAASATVRRNLAPMFLDGGEVTGSWTDNVDLWDRISGQGPTAQSQLVGAVSVHDPLLASFAVKAGTTAASLGAGAVPGAHVGGVPGTPAQQEIVFQQQLARVRSMP